MIKRDVAKRLRHYREKSTMNQEELEKALEKHSYKFTRGYISLCETGRSQPSLDFLRGCELVYGLAWGELIYEWAGYVAESKGESKHITAYQSHQLLGRYLQSRQGTTPAPPLEEGPTSSGEVAVEEPEELG